MKERKKTSKKTVELSGFSYVHLLSGSLSKVEVLRVGTVYDRDLKITPEMLDDFVKNFHEGVYGTEIQMNFGHQREGEAAGWIKNLFVEGETLMATVEWTPLGEEKIKAKQYRFTSSEFSLSYPHFKTGDKVKNVFVGCALTNIPAMKGMAPVQLHENYQQFINNQNMNDLKELFEILSGKKAVTKVEYSEFKELAEQSGLKDDAGVVTMLSDLEEKVEGGVDEEEETEEKEKEKTEETEEEKTAREEKEAKEAAEKEEADKKAAEELAEKEKNMVQLSEAELQNLREKAAKTEQLEEQVRITELKEVVKTEMCLSEEKKVGFKDGAETIDKVAKFMAGLSQEQVQEFKDILGEVQTVDLSERGRTVKADAKTKSKEELQALAEKEAKELHEENPEKALHTCLVEKYSEYGLDVE